MVKERDKNRNLSADQPLLDPDDDRLGYKEFANHLARSIGEMAPVEGFVIALYGAWGSGKSTLLNFVRHYLEVEFRDKQQLVTVNFNPWWFSGREDLTSIFFSQLLAVLESKSEAFAKKLIEPLNDLAQLVSEVPVTPVKGVGNALKLVTDSVLKKRRDIVKVKEEVSDLLRKKQLRILIIIDDIDRLTSEEIRQLFRVIKAVANLPFVTYLLAFDRKVVVTALEHMQQGIPGEDYLEKIVQLPFELPLPEPMGLYRVLFEQLDEILSDTPEETFDRERWDAIFQDGIKKLITVPRDILRLTNTLRVTYPAVKGEVNPVDFVAIETIRVFCPMVYDHIRRNPHHFVGYDQHISAVQQDAASKSFHDAWVDKLEEQAGEPIKQIARYLFPRLDVVWGKRSWDQYYGAAVRSPWRRQLRICSSDVFPVYFRLALPEGTVSHAEVCAILELAGDPDALSKRLIELVEHESVAEIPVIRTYLDRLGDFIEDIPPDKVPTMLEALLNRGDAIAAADSIVRSPFEIRSDRSDILLYRMVSVNSRPSRNSSDLR